MTLAARTQALLDLVEQDRRAQVATLQADAQAQAAALLASARSDARTRMREVFTEERTRLQVLLDAAQADLQTRRRLHEQRRVETLLAQAWQQLPEAMHQRWSDAAMRQRWVDRAVADARAVLPAARWRITHGQPWPAAERDALSTQLQPLLGSAPLFHADDSIRAGLRIAANGNVVDATLDGLLADRDEIGGRLIGELEAQP